ncbi:MAG: LysR family transcriptional regulator [Clostridia bacterium]
MENDEIRFTLHVKLKKSDIFFGNGICELLELIDEHHSINVACENMGMAYSKAWRIIKKAESELGYPVITRKIGGNHGGGSVLTLEGKILLQKYKDFRAEVFQNTEEIFRKYFT